MKKVVSILLSLLIIMSVTVLAGCGDVDVFEKSKNDGKFTLVMEDGKSYGFKNMVFEYNEPKDVFDASELEAPKGKWVAIILKLKNYMASDEEIKSLCDGENILLSGAAYSTYKYDFKSDKGAVFYFDDKGKAVPRESYIYLYYDIPEEYRLTNAVVTCFDQIREIN